MNPFYCRYCPYHVLESKNDFCFSYIQFDFGNNAILFSSIIIIIDETMITSANGMKTITPARTEEAQCSSGTSVEPAKNSLMPKLRMGIPTHDPISVGELRKVV